MDITTAGCETQLPDHTGREKPANPAAPEESPQDSSQEEMRAPEPTYIHTTEPANGRRFLADFGDQLTIAYDEDDPCVDIYALEADGRLSGMRARTLLMQTGQRYLLAACKKSGQRLTEKDHFVVYRDACLVNQTSYFDKMRRVIRMVLMQLDEAGVRHGVRWYNEPRWTPTAATWAPPTAS